MSIHTFYAIYFTLLIGGLTLEHFFKGRPLATNT